MNVLLAVTGSIAAYKACDVVSGLRSHGHDVRVLLTRGGRRFITEDALAAISGNPVLGPGRRDLDGGIAHIDEADRASILVVAPATARSIARLAGGAAEDDLGLVALALPQDTPRLVCPAMNTRMYTHPATRAHLAVLRGELGWQVVDPVEKRLACGHYGVGALAPPRTIVAAVQTLLETRPVPAGTSAPAAERTVCAS